MFHFNYVNFITFFALLTHPATVEALLTDTLIKWTALYTECKYGGPLGRRPGRVV